MNSVCSFFMNMKKFFLDFGFKINENFKLKKIEKELKGLL